MTMKHRLLSKGDLCRIFSLYRGDGLNYQKLRQKILTDDVLNKVGLTPEEYKAQRGDFDYHISSKIIEHLKLDFEEYQQMEQAA